MSKETLKKQIKEAILKNPFRQEIQKVSLFGSYLSGKPKKDSDVDILIEFTPEAKVGFFKLAQIQRNVESHLNKSVDLLTPEQLSEFFRDEVLKKAEAIYEK